MSRFTKKQIEQMPEWAQQQIKEQTNAEDARAKAGWNIDTESQCGERKALGVEGKAEGQLVDIAGPVLVRITRVSKRKLDDDNLSGGCKELRDAIASALGRKGDSEEDGMKWEYRQERGAHATIVEIFKEDD